MMPFIIFIEGHLVRTAIFIFIGAVIVTCIKQMPCQK